MATEAELDASVRRVLGEILADGEPYTSIPLIDPDTKLPPAPTVDAIRAPLESAVTDLDESVAQLEPAVDSLQNLVDVGRLSEPTLTSTIGSVIEGSDYLPATFAPISVLSSQASFPIPNPKYTMVTTFQSGHGFTSSGSGTFDLNRVASDAAIGTQYARVTTNGAGAGALITKHALAPFDSTGHRFGFLVRVSDETKVLAIDAYLYNTVTTNYALYGLNPTVTNGRSVALGGGWTWIYFTAADIVSTNGTFDPTAITGWRVRVSDKSAGAVVFDIQAMATFPVEPAQQDVGIVSFSCDDGFVSHRNWFAPTLAAYGGWAATAFPIASLNIAGSPNYYTPAQMRELQNVYRWDFGGHAFDEAMHSSGGYTNGWTDDQVRADILANITWLQNQGVRWSGMFAWPGGGVNQTLMDIASQFYSLARSSAEKPYATATPDRPMDLRSIGVFAGRATSVYTNAITAAINNKLHINFRIHDILASGASGGVQVNQADIITLLDAVKVGVDAGTLRVATLGQVARFNQQ